METEVEVSRQFWGQCLQMPLRRVSGRRPGRPGAGFPRGSADTTRPGVRNRIFGSYRQPHPLQVALDARCVCRHVSFEVRQWSGIAFLQVLNAGGESLGQPLDFALDGGADVRNPLVFDHECLDLGLAKRGVFGQAPAGPRMAAFTCASLPRPHRSKRARRMPAPAKGSVLPATAASK